MKIFVWLCLCFMVLSAHADTMDHYMNISKQIPQMEMKADQQSQAWARSARTVLAVANESIAETLIQANEIARQQGKPLYCLPDGVLLTSSLLHDIIIKTFEEISSQQSDKAKMTVSQAAWIGVAKNYPCNNKPQAFGASPVQNMQHVMGIK